MSTSAQHCYVKCNSARIITSQSMFSFPEIHQNKSLTETKENSMNTTYQLYQRFDNQTIILRKEIPLQDHEESKVPKAKTQLLSIKLQDTFKTKRLLIISHLDNITFLQAAKPQKGTPHLSKMLSQRLTICLNTAAMPAIPWNCL